MGKLKKFPLTQYSIDLRENVVLSYVSKSNRITLIFILFVKGAENKT